MSSVCHLYVLVCHSYITCMWFYHEPEKILLNKVELRDMCKWSSKRMAKPRVQNLWSNLNESYFSNIFLTHSARTAVGCLSINFCFEFLEKRRIFMEFSRRSHSV